MPDAMMQALGHRLPRSVPETIRDQLAHRSPQQLYERIERRWYSRWSHALTEKDAEGRRRWHPDEVAVCLVRAGWCQAAGCEDGRLLDADCSCPACSQPEHRFTPGQGRPASPQVASRAAADMRRALLSSPLRTGALTGTRIGSPRRTSAEQRASMDAALERVRAQNADPATPRLRGGDPLPEPGPEDSVILEARAARQAVDDDPVYRAARQRARAERAGRVGRER
ncbi:hypothetical protein [Streptomyces sp. H27-D2]|uniref:hypothetical protein n=1 Tax=Streptomyces sp. H27-D2 TaxID=3046304 RepID=UPI002DBBEF9A|nr:hypothetical protein [Streptomyces sp. H27-D2]MEC4015366.1 hypothetical protein [Streptomyces sp. H27-D2]